MYVQCITHGCIESTSTCTGIKIWYMYYIVRKHICVHTYQYLTILGNIYTVHFVQHHIFQIIHVTDS
jgi:hypothetical protein